MEESGGLKSGAELQKKKGKKEKKKEKKEKSSGKDSAALKSAKLKEKKEGKKAKKEKAKKVAKTKEEKPKKEKKKKGSKQTEANGAGDSNGALQSATNSVKLKKKEKQKRDKKKDDASVASSSKVKTLKRRKKKEKTKKEKEQPVNGVKENVELSPLEPKTKSQTEIQPTAEVVATLSSSSLPSTPSSTNNEKEEKKESILLAEMNEIPTKKRVEEERVLEKEKAKAEDQAEKENVTSSTTILLSPRKQKEMEEALAELKTYTQKVVAEVKELVAAAKSDKDEEKKKFIGKAREMQGLPQNIRQLKVMAELLQETDLATVEDALKALILAAGWRLKEPMKPERDEEMNAAVRQLGKAFIDLIAKAKQKALVLRDELKKVEEGGQDDASVSGEWARMEEEQKKEAELRRQKLEEARIKLEQEEQQRLKQEQEELALQKMREREEEERRKLKEREEEERRQKEEAELQRLEEERRKQMLEIARKEEEERRRRAREQQELEEQRRQEREEQRQREREEKERQRREAEANAKSIRATVDSQIDSTFSALDNVFGELDLSPGGSSSGSTTAETNALLEIEARVKEAEERAKLQAEERRRKHEEEEARKREEEREEQRKIQEARQEKARIEAELRKREEEERKIREEENRLIAELAAREKQAQMTIQISALKQQTEEHPKAGNEQESLRESQEEEERKRQIEEQKKQDEEEKKKLEEARKKQEEEDQKRLEEQQKRRVEQWKRQEEEEKQRKAAEEARQAELEKQKQEKEAQRLEREKRIAEERRLQAEQREQQKPTERHVHLVTARAASSPLLSLDVEGLEQPTKQQQQQKHGSARQPSVLTRKGSIADKWKEKMVQQNQQEKDKQRELNYLRVKKEVQFMDRQIRVLIQEMKRLSPEPTEPPILARVDYGTLFQKTMGTMPALSATLVVAKKRGVVEYEGSLLLQGAHDGVIISMLKDEIEDSEIPEQEEREAVVPQHAESTPAFSGPEKCAVCEKTVYQLERISANGSVFHKACFRCHVCKNTLKLTDYAHLDGKYYCPTHFEQLFKVNANYTTGFGAK
ncbi:Eukaryotic translation initiation factor 3subunit A [Balamuthia mandrillaris]